MLLIITKINEGRKIMRIIRLQAENIKKIKAIDITPTTDVVIISGNNGAGKSSALDAIWYALAGKSGLKKTPKPIREGEKNASVTLTLDNFIVTRNFTANNKSYLKVTNKEGLSYNSPQELLDSFIGKLTFDPLEFAQMREIDQRNLLLMVADIDIDYWDSALISLREERRVRGQTVKLYEGEREEITIKDLPELPIDTSKLSFKYDEAVSTNNLIERKKEGLQTNINIVNESIEDINRKKEEIEEIQKEIEDIKRETIVIKEANDKTKEWLSKNKSINTDNIKEEMNNAHNTNDQIKTRERNKEADKKQKEAQKVYDGFTEKIEGVAKEKETALSEAKMPISGLGINDTGVTYNDIPFGQLSSSEQLRVSLSIAMSVNPELKVIRITDGSLLDENNMEIIKKLAEKKDYQVWLEKVSDSGEIGFYFVEGEITKVNGEPTDKESIHGKVVDAESGEGGLEDGS